MPTYINFGSQPQQVQVEHRFDYEAGSNPLVTSNPPQVGDSWVNTTTGEIFVCIDATADANVWKGTQGVVIRNNLLVNYYAEINSYVMGGGGAGTGPSDGDVKIDKIQISNDNTSLLLSELSNNSTDGITSRNEISGYKLGGAGGSNNIADKVTYSSDAVSIVTSSDFSNIGDGDSWSYSNVSWLIGGSGANGEVRKLDTTSESLISTIANFSTSQYASGDSFQTDSNGWYLGHGSTGATNRSLEKMSFSSEARFTSSTSKSHANQAGSVSDIDGQKGYFVGGYGIWVGDTFYSGPVNTCQKINLASETDASTYFGSLSGRYIDCGGFESQTYGYIVGGGGGAGTPEVNGIERVLKFQFANDNIVSSTNLQSEKLSPHILNN